MGGNRKTAYFVTPTTQTPYPRLLVGNSTRQVPAIHTSCRNGEPCFRCTVSMKATTQLCCQVGAQVLRCNPVIMLPLRGRPDLWLQVWKTFGERLRFSTLGKLFRVGLRFRHLGKALSIANPPVYHRDPSPPLPTKTQGNKSFN